MIVALLVTLAAPAHVLTLDEALKSAARAQPQIRQARANTDAARARADEARAPLLPQVNGTAGYRRATANFAAPAGSLPKSLTGVTTSTTSLDTFDYFNFGLTVNQLL